MRILVTKPSEDWRATVEVEQVDFRCTGAVYFDKEIPTVLLIRDEHAHLLVGGAYSPLLIITKGAV